jgi:GNAT superfamily N-acetyltransferase
MFSIRPVVPDDLPFLWEMLWEAAAVAPELRAMGREAALAIPSIRKYLDGWGRPGDAGVIAVGADGKRLGAAWYRRFPADDPGYGFVANDIPELSIGVAVEARGQGVGRALLDALLATARQQGCRATMRASLTRTRTRSR